MQVEAVNPETGERFTLEMSSEELEQLVRDARPRLSKKDLEQRIEKLEISADVKLLLASFIGATAKIGNVVLKIGRRILEIVFDLVKRHPNFTFAIVMYLVGALLLSVAPWLAPILVPIVEVMTLVFALVKDHLELGGKIAARRGNQADNRSLAKDDLKTLENEPVYREPREAIQIFALKGAI